MLRGYRGPALALLASLILLSLVWFTRPAQTTPDVVSTQQPILATATLLPALTAAPTIPFQQLDTSTLREAIVGCVKKINPLLAGYNQPDLDVSSLIFEGLATTDEFGAAIPALASEWKVSNDSLEYAVSLRQDVKWHDGVPFTSADVVFTINLMQADDFPGRSDLHTFWQTVEVDAIDEYTVRFRLAQPLAAFTDYLRIGILPKHALDGISASRLASHLFNLSPIGTGPYQFDGLIGTANQITGVRLRLSATFTERPEAKGGYALREIEFHCYPSFNDAIAAFQRGDVNTVNELPAEIVAQVAALPQLVLYPAYRPSFGAVIYNWQRDDLAFFRDFRMRQALLRSVDRTALVSANLPHAAIAADSPILPSSWAYTDSATCPGYDPKNPDAAKNLLAQVQSKSAASAPSATEAADSPHPGGTTPIQFQLLVNNEPALATMAQSIAKTWSALGIPVSAVVVDTATFRERLTSGNFDAALLQLDLAPSSDPDPYSLWRQLPKEGGLNFGGMNDRRLSELMENARRETNGVQRTERYREFQRLFCERAAALLLYYPVYTYGADNRLQGIQLGFMSDPADRFRTIKDWHFEQQP
jgi:peptide/nickel transport system substrate-binding protein